MVRALIILSDKFLEMIILMNGKNSMRKILKSAISFIITFSVMFLIFGISVN